MNSARNWINVYSLVNFILSELAAILFIYVFNNKWCFNGEITEIYVEHKLSSCVWNGDPSKDYGTQFWNLINGHGTRFWDPRNGYGTQFWDPRNGYGTWFWDPRNGHGTPFSDPTSTRKF